MMIISHQILIYEIEWFLLLAVVVCGTCTSAAEVAAALRGPGLLDHTLTLRAPAAEDRAALMSSGLQSKGVAFDAVLVQVMRSMS